MNRSTILKIIEKLLVPLVVAIIGAGAVITAALITSGHFAPKDINPSPTASEIIPTNTPSGNYAQLKSFYHGTASGYTNGAITFTLVAENQQGDVSMQTTFQQLESSQKSATYSCQGSVTLDKHINLQCSNVTDQSYMLTIQGYIYPDGHLEGTEIATNTNDSSYRHVYYWKAY